MSIFIQQLNPALARHEFPHIKIPVPVVYSTLQLGDGPVRRGAASPGKAMEA